MASRDSAAADFTTASTVAIDTILAEEANRIGQDIHKRVTHTSPWIDLVKKSAFPDGMGYKLTTLVYDRALPTTDAVGDTIMGGGAGWNDVGTVAAANEFGASMLDQPIADAADSVQGANGDGSDSRNYVNFSKVIKQYNIKRAILESPRINVDDLRYAAHRQEQLRAVMDSLAESTRWSWENRNRSEFDRLSDNVVACRTSATAFGTGKEGTLLEDLVDADTIGTVDDASAGVSDDTASGVTGDLSNAVMDKIYFQLVRKGAGRNSYGRENGRPVFALVCSSQASFGLMTESDAIRNDIRYNSAKVSDLIAPLGIEQSFRGFYHLIDDLSPRYAIATSGSAGNTVDPVYPYKVTNGIVTDNPDYDLAPFEAAYVLHPEVFETQIPAPFSGASGVNFDPVKYTGEFKWKNILSESANPDGTIGFFRGVLASASKPIKTEYGYTILFKRDTTAAAV